MFVYKSDGISQFHREEEVCEALICGCGRSRVVYLFCIYSWKWRLKVSAAVSHVWTVHGPFLSLESHSQSCCCGMATKNELHSAFVQWVTATLKFFKWTILWTLAQFNPFKYTAQTLHKQQNLHIKTSLWNTTQQYKYLLLTLIIWYYENDAKTVNTRVQNHNTNTNACILQTLNMIWICDMNIRHHMRCFSDFLKYFHGGNNL